jgi:hypothetical protein
MGTVTHLPRPINWASLRSDEAERIIRRRAAEDKTGGVIFTNHTWDRVSEREITRSDIFDILRGGFCCNPYKNEKGHWQVIVVKRISGRRDAGVVTIILDKEEKLIVRTVEWMDIK